MPSSGKKDILLPEMDAGCSDPGLQPGTDAVLWDALPHTSRHMPWAQATAAQAPMATGSKPCPFQAMNEATARPHTAQISGSTLAPA
jgi:hypothetical protein